MSVLPVIEKLLEGVEVEWKRLGDISTLITKGTTPKEFCSDGVNYIKIENILDGKVSLTKRTFVSEIDHFGELKRSVLVENDILFAIAGSIGKCAIVDPESLPANTNQALAIIRLKESVNHRYVFYALQTGAMKDYISKFNKTSAQPNLNLKQMGDFIIPIPPLNVQAEIVRILDAFTAYTAELTAELTARKKQYNHYRDQLLSFSETEVEWRTLGEICEIYDSLHQTPKYSDIGKSMIRVTDINDGVINLEETLKVDHDVFTMFTKKYRPQKGDLVMSRVGSYGRVGIIPGDDCACMGQNTVVMHPSVNHNYLFHVLISKLVQDHIAKNVGGGSQKTLSLKAIKAIPIPVVPKDKQIIIASVLDKFNSLTTSITEGLPREIELRQKQYEYYRDRLLSFPKPASDAAA